MTDVSGGQPGRGRLGLVLGAGGRAGAMFHRGVVRAMEESGLDPRAADVIVGTSAGALVGASLRRGARARPAPPLREPNRAFRPGRHMVLEMVRRPREGLNALLLRPDLRFGELDMVQVLDRVRTAHGTTWPAAPLWLVAVRRGDGRRVVFGRPGAPPVDVASAVAASCAVPGYVDPVEIYGVAYVDGGVHSPTNADVLADTDLDLVVVSSPMSIDLTRGRPRADLLVRLRFRQFLRSEVWALRRHVRQVVTIEPDRETLEAIGARMLSTARGTQIEAAAFAQARWRLQAVNRNG